MESTFGVLDAFAFVVFAILLAVAVIIIVSLGQLPGRLARKWGHPQAAAINVAGWIGVATGGLVWPVALIWAFMIPAASSSSNIKRDQQPRDAAELDASRKREAPHTELSADKESRP
jgi:hypothetical protein